MTAHWQLRRGRGRVGDRIGAGERKLVERTGLRAGSIAAQATHGLRRGIRNRAARLRAGHERSPGSAPRNAAVVEHRRPRALIASVGQARAIHGNGVIDRSRRVDEDEAGRTARRVVTAQERRPRNDARNSPRNSPGNSPGNSTRNDPRSAIPGGAHRAWGGHGGGEFTERQLWDKRPLELPIPPCGTDAQRAPNHFARAAIGV